MFVKLVILSIIFLAIAAIAFGIRMLLKPKARFPELHISGNEEMRKRGIKCAQETDVGCNSRGGGCSCGRIY